MKQKVKIISVSKTDEHEGTVTFQINGRHFDAFFWGDNFLPGEELHVSLTQLEYPLSWETVFGENKGREIKIEKSNVKDWAYYCYGTIQSVRPVIANFGDFQLDLGDWINDDKVVGQFIYWTIDRLDIKRV
ncbi:MAG: hypothetical protein ACMVP2_22800 [Imperialibacter sp.]|uniref:hypothetical protein n=1 Tax=Imperialibacter sp. TaxID=2038411 RepID=UPI003A860C6F